MALTRSSTRKSSLGDEPTTTTPAAEKKRLKLHNPNPEKKGTVPLCTSSRQKLKNRTTGCPRKKKTCPLISSSPTVSIPPNPGSKIREKFREIGESALSDYNKQNGTDLEYVRPLDDKSSCFRGPGYVINFGVHYAIWCHFNFEARRRNADPSDKPLILFAEVYKYFEKFVLTSLLPVEPNDGAMGCQQCRSNISHPHHGFRAGFYNKWGKGSKMLSEQEAAFFSKFALQDYNEKHGTNLKFERALSCNRFESAGLLMDFSKTNKTSWVHMNFEARVGPNEEVLGLFAELYLGEGEKFVLSTLSVAEPSDVCGDGEWKKEMKIDHGLCRCCPCEIYHTWRGFHYGYNYPPQ